eukprot:1513322-Pyramimonas_sp.AAC.1
MEMEEEEEEEGLPSRICRSASELPNPVLPSHTPAPARAMVVIERLQVIIDQAKMGFVAGPSPSVGPKPCIPKCIGCDTYVIPATLCNPCGHMDGAW